MLTAVWLSTSDLSRLYLQIRCGGVASAKHGHGGGIAEQAFPEEPKQVGAGGRGVLLRSPHEQELFA